MPRSALIGGTASLVPKQLQSITSSLGKISGPLFPFAIAAQELEGVFFSFFLDFTTSKMDALINTKSKAISSTQS
jgi:hypothetical protein